jgi:hypothetical protein
VTHIVLSIVSFSALATSLASRSASSQQVDLCHAEGPTGYFTGTARSRQTGQLEIALNLRCHNGTYTGELATPLGTYAITGGHADSGRVQLLFAAGSDVGTIDATLQGETASGRFVISSDTGLIALRRAGDSRPGRWDSPVLDLGTTEWHEDLAFFGREIVARHGNAFHSLTRSRFDSALTLLDKQLGSLTGDELYVELDKIANLIGDAHTYVVPPQDSPQFPIQVRRFGGAYRIVAVTNGNEPLLGTRLLKLQDQPVAVVMQRLLGLTPAAEHPSLRQARAERFLRMGLMLHGLGLTPARDTVTLSLADDAGRQFRVSLSAVPRNTQRLVTWKDAFTNVPLYLRHPGTAFWCQHLRDARAVYCSFRGYDSLASHAAALRSMVGTARPEKLVIDMRQNGGGDYTLGLKHLIEPLSRVPYLNRRGHLFVLIGANTFSAGMANATQFRSRTGAILVGETIGEKPNSFQEPREMRLPNSHLIVRYSTRYYRFVDQGPNAVEPDHSVVPTWAEYRAGQDPVLEWVLRYPSP